MLKRRFMKVIVIIFSSIMILTIFTFMSLLIISGIFEKPKYLEPWKRDYARKFNDSRIQLAAHGLLAASGHNMQPWKIQLDKGDPMVFYLYADSRHTSNEADPFSRQLMISQGTFLEYVKIAGEKAGYKTNIELFPEGIYDEQNLSESMDLAPAAKITLTEPYNEDTDSYDFIFMSDTNRYPYKKETLTHEQLGQLENISMYDGVFVKVFQAEEDLEVIGRYILDGASTEAGVSRVMKEAENIFRPNEYQKNKYRYGFSVEGRGTSGMVKHLMQGMVTLFPSMNSKKAAADMFIQSAREAAEHTYSYAMIITKDNTRESQIKSGMVYSKLILTAHKNGLAMQPLSQVLEEYPEMTEIYRGIHDDYASEGGTIQMLLRVGVPSKEFPPSMRRDVMDLIVKE